MSQPKVSNYKLFTSNGRPIRTATKVTFGNGKTVSFMDKVPKGRAIESARKEIRKGF